LIDVLFILQVDPKFVRNQRYAMQGMIKKAIEERAAASA